MKTWPSTIQTELIADVARVFFAVHIGLDTVLRYIDCDIQLAVNGDAYTPCALEIGNVSYRAGMQVDSMEIIFPDADQVLVQASLANDIRRKPVQLRMACVDAGYQVLGSVLLWSGVINKSGPLREKTVTLDIVSQLAMWHKKTLRLQGSTCPWEYGGTECGHAGDGTCDQSHDRCTALGNTDNFGGDRFLDVTAERPIVWGQKANL